MDDSGTQLLAFDSVDINAVLIVESLKEREVKTGEILRGYIQGKVAELGLPVRVLFERRESAAEFVELIRNVTETVRTKGARPILHVEAHGSLDDGIWFADGSLLPWSDFCKAMVPLNQALDLCLVVVVAACFGISLINGVSLRQPAPCMALIGPTDEIDPGEVMRFRSMYAELFTSLSADRMFEALYKIEIEAGGLTMLTAAHWFDMLMSRYLREEATPKYVKDFALRRHRADKQQGSHFGMRAYKRLYRENLPRVVRAYFESYFMYDSLAGSRARFEHLWPRLQSQVDAAVSRL